MLINRRAVCFCLLTGFLVAALGFCPVTGAQDSGTSYTWDTVDPVYENNQTLATQKVIKQQVIGGRMNLNANRTAMDNWYRKYKFAGMATRENLGELPDMRDELGKDLAYAKRDVALHQFLVDLAYEEATKRVRGNYHPAVRFNALLIVGDLNRVESRYVGSDRFPAIRLPKALDFLVEELRKPDQLDALRLASLIGIERHLRLDQQRPQDAPIPDAKKAEIATIAQQMMNEKTPPPGRTAEGHTWMRRRAVDVLAALGLVGDSQSVFKSLVEIATDAESPMSLRCTAARALERLDYTDITDIDPIAVSQQLGTLAASACRAEDARVKEEQANEPDDAQAGGSFYSGLGGYPGAGGYDGGEESGDDGEEGFPDFPGSGYSDPASTEAEEMPIDEHIQRVRRRLKLPLHCVLLALRGQPKKAPPGTPKGQKLPLGAVGQLAQEQQLESQVREIVEAVEALVVATDTFEEGLDEMMKEIRVKTRDLESLLPQPEEEPEESPAEDSLPGASLPGGSSKTTPSKTTPSKTTPGKTTPSKTTPSKTTPSKTTPSKTTPSKTTPSKTTPSKTTPSKTAPGKTTPGS